MSDFLVMAQNTTFLYNTYTDIVADNRLGMTFSQ